ncbi:MAG TPA: SCP2 sterol-binding domain-containing protein [Aeromicrobium sp.]|nr:SCP2 sterol-binding domain-containing protein [Aeromicrobium sp.]
MSDATEDFFEELERRGHEPLVGKFSGNVRFELRKGKRTVRWVLTIDHGDVTVSRGDSVAACTIAADMSFFDRLCRGEVNAMAATLRGALVCTGDADLLLAVQRLFPGPPQPVTSGGR